MQDQRERAMNTDTMRRAERHAHRLSARALKGAGKLRSVGSALGVHPSRVGHWRTDQAHPVLVPAFGVMCMLNAAKDATARSFADAAMEAVELREIIGAETDVILRRGTYLLLEWEHELEARENRAALMGPGHSEALRAEASAQIELATTIEELAARGLDLHAIARGGAR